MRPSYLLLTGVAVALCSPVSAEPQTLNVAANQQWTHKPSGVALPPAVAGLRRDRVSAYVLNQLDVSGNYASGDGSDQITIFLFRNVSGSVPVWFDRASTMIQLLPEKYVSPQSLGARRFTPRGQPVPSGLIETFNVEGQFSSTALALLPVNGFYAKIRASSPTKDAAALEQLVLSVVQSFDWSSTETSVAASPISDCAAPLAEHEPAEKAQTTSDDRMMSALVGAVIAQTAPPVEVKVSSYCREPGRNQRAYGVYRPESATNRYLVALHDSGRAIAVGNSTVLQVLREQNTKPRTSVSYIDLDKTLTFGDFATLPLPEQALAQVQDSTPLSVATTWGEGERQITITTDE